MSSSISPPAARTCIRATITSISGAATGPARSARPLYIKRVPASSTGATAPACNRGAIIPRRPSDPNNLSSFWLSNEYVASNWWQTSVAKVTIQGPAATSPAISSIANCRHRNHRRQRRPERRPGRHADGEVQCGGDRQTTTGGTPTLTLNDGGAATFVGGWGTTALTFSYTVGAGQNTPDLIVSAFNLNGANAGLADAAGNVANLSGATNNNPAGTLQSNCSILPSVSSIATSGAEITNGSGNLGTGQGVTLTVK